MGTKICRVRLAATVSYTWSNAKLEPGIVCQFRVLRWRGNKVKGQSDWGMNLHLRHRRFTRCLSVQSVTSDS
ncbi:MAG: hypothetical protein EP343_09375 [Deltaproteobacteria bacterium]|nr:MAG: hypothetical protein EP343_09375 [Deltaproteobacteria bacterium]